MDKTREPNKVARSRLTNDTPKTDVPAGGHEDQ